ncbi:MAG TPA: hypothetical protein DIT13_19235 [Verrucomicrobiales bacterium]|nr:hypothetical protein [Verrucomicrobiales bacterium]HRJ08470.1 hypothetical protein [Prosthecobacter sp.]HRK15836.1 hypothetical protein [Prosthecobacter sp.]
MNGKIRPLQMGCEGFFSITGFFISGADSGIERAGKADAARRNIPDAQELQALLTPWFERSAAAPEAPPVEEYAPAPQV